MHPRQDLVTKFAKAGLKLKLEADPLLRIFRLDDTDRMRSMFQLDIQKEKNQEVFRIFPGADTNHVEVAAVDPSVQQVVLVVKEASVEFEVEVPSSTVKHQKDRHEATLGEGWIDQMMREQRARLSRVQHGHSGIPRVWAKMKTPAGRRYFLAGMDERNLFICQLPRAATSVREAHAMLKHPTVTMREGRLPGKTIRQGEWFFANLTPEDEVAIEAALKKGVAVEKKCPIGTAVSGEVFGQGRKHARQRGGNPHVADEVLIVSTRDARHMRNIDVFVRGAVRHKDHGTIKFGSWRRVFRNMERNQGSNMLGVNFVD